MNRFEKTADPEIKRDAQTGIYFYRGTPTRGGRRIARSLGVRVFRTAQLQKKDLLLRLRGVDPSARDILFGDYCKVFLQERKTKAPATHEQAHYSVKAMLPFFESHTMKQINERTWAEYVAYQHQLNPTRLLKYDRRHLRMMLYRLKKKGIVSEIPDFNIEEREIKRRRVLTSAETDLILKHSEGSLYGLCLIMMKMGARPGEVVGLPWSELDLEAGIWALPKERTKTRTARTMVINSVVLKWLKEQKKSATSLWVFPTREDETKHLVNYRKQWERMLKRSGLDESITVYFLRHTFLTECAKRVRDGKLSLVLITKYAGTSIDEFERTYLHVDGQDTKDVAELMESPL